MTKIVTSILTLFLLLGTAYAQQGEAAEQIRLLKTAIEKEPDNSGYYASLGVAYDNLYLEELKAGNEAKAQQYLDHAKSYYLQALEKDPSYFEVVYAVGTLYYNHALIKLNIYNSLDLDFSDAGKQKANALRKEIAEWYGKALPYYQRAESMNPNDIYTLMALKLTFAALDMEDMLAIFTQRLKVVKDGGTHSASYFMQTADGITERGKG